MYNVLVLGSNGMLGQMVNCVLSNDENLNIVSTSKIINDSNEYFNVFDGIVGLEKILESQKPQFDYIINCIGILNNKINNKDSESITRAIHINSLFPHNLVFLANKTGARVIHISTDGVFGRHSGKCSEDNICDSYELYGKTKSIGEVIGSNFLNIRTSIIGPNPINKSGLMEWFFSQQKDGKVYGFSDQKWNGVTTLQFAELCNTLILDNYFDKVFTESPIHHFCPNKTINKYELLKLFKKYYRFDLTVIPKVNGEESSSRTLTTKFHSIIDKFGKNILMEDAIKKLSNLEKK